LISRIRIASVGRDLGIQIYEQEMLEWQEHAKENPVERPASPGPPVDFIVDFIRDALLIFDPPAKPEDGG
jgi:hypothetical protein